MTGIGRYRLEFLLKAQKVILSHQSKHALVVNHIAPVLEFCSHPPVTVAKKLQSDLLNLVLQIHIRRWDRFQLYPPFVVAAATHFECLAGLGY